MLERKVKQLPPTCCCFVFIIGEKFKPAEAFAFIFPSVAVNFTAAVECYQQIVTITLGADNLQMGDGAGLNAGADRKVGCGCHDVFVVDSVSLQDGWGDPSPPLCILTICHNGVHCFLCSPVSRESYNELPVRLLTQTAGAAVNFTLVNLSGANNNLTTTLSVKESA